MTFSIHPAKRGPKPKRSTDRLANLVISGKVSLRGLAKYRKMNRESLRCSSKKSLDLWKRNHDTPGPLEVGAQQELIALIDAMRFKFNNQEYTVFIILLRPVDSNLATLRSLKALQGHESYALWKKVVYESLTISELACLKALVADGTKGICRLAKEGGWVYQRCHFHLMQDMWDMRGFLRGPTQAIRKAAYYGVRKILNTDDPLLAQDVLSELIQLAQLPECPRSVSKKISGFRKHFAQLRACYDYPELRLPATSNACENICKLIRSRLSPMRGGIQNIKTLEYWLDVIVRQHIQTQCRPKYPQ